jgi:tetratricopeptide (TPR) repeat protein
MATFFICYLLVVAKAISPPRWLSAFLLYALLLAGLYTKVVMVTAVPVGIMLNSLMTNQTLVATVKSHWKLHIVPLAFGLMLVLAMVPMLMRSEAGIGFGGDAPAAGIYLMSSFRAFAMYLGLAVWPSSLTIDRGPHFITDWKFAVPYAIGFVVYFGLACFAWRTGFGRYPLRRCLGWLMLSPLFILAPTSSIVPTADPVFEHRFYLPLAFVISTVAFGSYGFLALRFGRSRIYRKVVLGLAVVILVLLAFRSSVRARDYASSVQVWRSALLVDAENARAAQNFVAALQHAELEAQLVAELKSLIVQSDRRGQRIDALAHQLAKAHLRRAEPEIAYPMLVEVTKRSTPVENLLTDRQRREVGERWFDLAVASAQLGRAPEGVQAIRQTLLATPNDSIAHAMAGDLFSAVGDLEAAERHWKMFQHLSPALGSRGSEGH